MSSPSVDSSWLKSQRSIEFDKKTYRRRSMIECCVGWLKECRAIATRFEKLAVNFLAMLKLALIQRYLRILDSSDRTWYVLTG